MPVHDATEFSRSVLEAGAFVDHEVARRWGDMDLERTTTEPRVHVVL